MNVNRVLSVSMVLYKTPLVQLRQCMRSLTACFSGLHIYIVDNSPTDELSAFFVGTVGIDYQHVPSNPGFGRAHNIAIRKSRSYGFTYHLVINADVYFDSDVLGPMIKYMDQHAEVGLMMPLVLNPDGSVQRLCKLVPTPADLFMRRFFGGRSESAGNRRFELHASGYNKIMFVPYLSGCFMLMRHSALKDVGLFDERFFMYPEDLDLSRRMAERYETLFYPLVSIFHEHGAASYKSTKMLLIHVFNMIKYFNKWGWFEDSVRDKLNTKTLSQRCLIDAQVDVAEESIVESTPVGDDK